MGATRGLLVRSITPDRREPSVELDAERMRSLLSLHRTVFIDLMLDCVVEPAEIGNARQWDDPRACPTNSAATKRDKLQIFSTYLPDSANHVMAHASHRSAQRQTAVRTRHGAPSSAARAGVRRHSR